MSMDLVYQLIAGGVILVLGVLFLRFIAIIIVAAIIGVGVYYNFMASFGEKEEAKICLKAIPESIYKVTFPKECNNMIHTIKSKVPSKLKKAATNDRNKTKAIILNKIN